MIDTIDTTDAAPRRTARQQILAFFHGRPGKHSTGAISEHVSAPQGTIYTTLSEMVARGELVRVSLGQYCLTGDSAAAGETTVAAPPPTARPARTKPATQPEPEPAGAVAPIEMAIWHTGELTLRRDGEDGGVLVLTGDEVRTLVDFLQRMIR